MKNFWISAVLVLAAIVFSGPYASSDTIDVQAASCPVSHTNPSARPPSRIPSSMNSIVTPVFPTWRWYGNRYLWTQLPPSGTVAMDENEVKFPWWRLRAGRLTITGHPLGALKPRMTAIIGPGYGSIGFQATGLLFPSPGCWRVSGHVRGKGLSFVIRVTGPRAR